MVLPDEVLDGRRQVRLLGQAEAFAHVLLDDFRAARGSQAIVGVPAGRLVLDEVLRLLRLSDVVIVGADPSQQGVRADRRAGGFGQVRDADRMCVGPRGFLRQLTQKRTIQVRQLQQGLPGGDSREALQRGEESAHDQHRADGRVEGAERRGEHQLLRRPRKEQAERQRRHEIRQRDHRDELPAVRSPAHDANGRGRRRPRGHRQERRAQSRQRRLAGEKRRDHHHRDDRQQAVEEGREQKRRQSHRYESGRGVRACHHAGEQEHDEDQDHYDGEVPGALVHLFPTMVVEDAPQDSDHDHGV